MLGLGWLRCGSAGAAWGEKEFSWCHFKLGVIQTSCSVWVGAGQLNAPKLRGCPKNLVCPPEPHPSAPNLFHPFYPGASPSSFMTPKELFLEVLKGLGVAEPLRAGGGQPGSSCIILVVMKSMGKSSP